jgi:single-stranded DNA-specific DHH superfamily exonuclease
MRENPNYKTMMKNYKKVLVVYHSEDNDGVCSAAIVKAFLQIANTRKNISPEYYVETFGVTHMELKRIWENYNDRVYTRDNPVANIETWKKYDMLFMVDMSF